MDARFARHATERPGGRRRSRERRAPRAAALTALLMLCCLFAAAAPAGAATTPGTPTANTPNGAIATSTPTFSWSKAKGATRYEVRVYQGKKLLLKKTGLSKRSWTSSKALPENVTLTWKVRAGNARGPGAWSKSLTFTVVAPSPEKAITAFSFLTPAVTGAINESLHTIALTVPYSTDVSALVATFTTSGASVEVGSAPQVSGTTANDFTSPVTYTVTAADASTQAYTVTVTVALVIGQAYQGGTIAFIDGTGLHGLIAATADQSAGIVWAVAAFQGSLVPGGTLTAMGTGAANTTNIITQNGAGDAYAAGVAGDYVSGIYGDWYLPSRDELNQLYLHHEEIGGFDESVAYWSSSEDGADRAWYEWFGAGARNSTLKNNTFRVRAVRTF